MSIRRDEEGLGIFTKADSKPGKAHRGVREESGRAGPRYRRHMYRKRRRFSFPIMRICA